MQTYRHPDIHRHAAIHTYRVTYRPTDIHRHTDIQTCRHTDIQSDMQTYRPTDIHRHTDMQTYRHADVQKLCRHADIQTCRHTDTQTCRPADVQTYRYDTERAHACTHEPHRRSQAVPPEICAPKHAMKLKAASGQRWDRAKGLRLSPPKKRSSSFGFVIFLVLLGGSAFRFASFFRFIFWHDFSYQVHYIVVLPHTFRR